MIGSTQQTIARPVTFKGAGVHSGLPSTLTVLPAMEGAGIRFRRMDLDGSPEIPADLDHVRGTDLGTTLALNETVQVMTVEHLLAALAAAGITRAIIDIDGVEPPILDGSFAPYLAAFREAGVIALEDPLATLRIPEPISYQGPKGGRYVAIPDDQFRVSVSIDFAHPSIGRQFATFAIDEGSFAAEIAPARTFGFEAEGPALRERGLARGTSLENTVVLSGDGILNPQGLRYPDEFVRHKMGDLVGDLSLLGRALGAHIIADRPSHAGNVGLARLLAEASRRDPAGEAIVDIQKIMEYLPHRFPMLLVDRVIDFEAGRRIVAIKNVTINEPFFQGHYPGHPIMPGVLIVEAMAQASGLLLMDTIENPKDKVVYFMSLDNVKWRRPVTPGDQLVFELEVVQLRRNICRMRGEAFVRGQLVAEAEFMARIMDR